MKNILNNAYTRAIDLIWPYCVRWNRLYDYNVRYPRYPAPGSEPIKHYESDYKTAYRDSIHHIRYLDFEKDHQARYNIADPVSEDPVSKLVRFNYLKEKDTAVQDALNAATKTYEAEQGEPLLNKGGQQKLLLIVHVNEIQDEAWDTMVKNNFSRESLAYFISDQFQSTNQINSHYPIENDFHDLYHPQVEEIKHLDMVSHDPVFRQLIVDQTFLLKKFSDARANSGQKVFKGDPSFWNAIDNSFSSENIKQVQSSIGDKISNLETTALDSVANKVEYHKEEIVPFPIKSKFVQ